MKKSVIIVVLFLTLFVFVSGCVNTNTSDSDSSNVTKEFENQWVKFEYPGNLNVVDNSQNNSIDILLINGKNRNDVKGEIQNSVNNKTMMINVNKQQNSTFETIAGKEGLYYNDSSGMSAYIFLEGDKGLWIDFYDHSYWDAFVMVKNSIIIKKIPS